MGRKFGIIAAMCLAFAVCFALVGCGGVNKAAYTGTWQLESGSDDNLDADSIALMKSLGLDVTMTLNEDGTGSLSLFGESMDLTWDATSNTEGTMTFKDSTAALKLEDGKLSLEDSTGSSMTFVKSDGAASSDSASSEAASSEGAPSSGAASSEAAAAEGDDSDEADDAEGESESSESSEAA